jgi:hypothetical protein
MMYSIFEAYTCRQLFVYTCKYTQTQAQTQAQTQTQTQTQTHTLYIHTHTAYLKYICIAHILLACSS